LGDFFDLLFLGLGEATGGVGATDEAEDEGEDRDREAGLAEGLRDGADGVSETVHQLFSSLRPASRAGLV
jgi:hypothetical protein